MVDVQRGAFVLLEFFMIVEAWPEDVLIIISDQRFYDAVVLKGLQVGGIFEGIGVIAEQVYKIGEAVQRFEAELFAPDLPGDPVYAVGVAGFGLQVGNGIPSRLAAAKMRWSEKVSSLSPPLLSVYQIMCTGVPSAAES